MASAVSSTATSTLVGTGRGHWMTFDEFCAEVRVSKDTAYKWSAAGPRSGKFPKCRRLPNGSIRIRRDWFEAWIEELGDA